ASAERFRKLRRVICFIDWRVGVRSGLLFFWQAVDIVAVAFGDFRILLVAIMDVKPVSKGRALALGNVKITSARRLVLKVMHSEWVRREQPVITNVPPGRVLGVGRVVKDGHADELPAHRTVV